MIFAKDVIFLLTDGYANTKRVNKMSFKDDTKRFKEIDKYKVRCKCSHTFIISRVDRALCSHCGNWVYKTPELEFKYKLQEKIKNGDKNG